MYEAHFGLRERPFLETTHPERYVSLPSREAALRRLTFGIEQAGGPVLLLGPDGVGKTMLGRVLMTRSRAAAVYVGCPMLTAREFLAWLAEALFGRSVTDLGRPIGESLRRIRDGLATRGARGLRSLLVVDEAHAIESPEVFDVLKTLLNFESGAGSPLGLVFLGGPDAAFRLNSGLADRLAARVALKLLDLDEARRLLRGQLTAMGASHPAAILSDEVIDDLYQRTGGSPRRLSRLAEWTLLVAAEDGRTSARRSDVETAAQGLVPEVRVA